MSLCPLTCENYSDPSVRSCSCGQLGDEIYCNKGESWDIRHNKAVAQDETWKKRAQEAETMLLITADGLHHIWDLDSTGRSATPFLMHERAEKILDQIERKKR